MSTPLPNISPPRLLKPVTGKIQNDGAPFVPLSPHKGVRNAVIIYEAIKNLPDQTLVRGDFNKRSQPLIYFPERPPKQVGKAPVDAVAHRNARHDRAEFASFMRSIVEATFNAAPVKAPELRAAFALRCTTIKVSEEQRDFTVGDIRDSLRSISKAYNRQLLKDITSPHRTQSASNPQLQSKRFKQFIDMNSSMFTQLRDALSLGIAGEDGETTSQMAIEKMKQMLFAYRILRETEDLSFVDFLQRHPIPRGAYTFAKLWQLLDGPDRSGRKLFCTESWALEMDKICPVIEKQYQSAKRLKHRGGGSEDWGFDDKSSSAESESETSSNPSWVSIRRGSRRRKTFEAVATDPMKGQSRVAVPQPTRQVSVPVIQHRTPDIRKEGTSHSSDPQISFIDSQPQIVTLIYSSIPTVLPSLPDLPSVISAPSAPVKSLAKATLEAERSQAEELSREPDDADNADVFSQDEH